MLTPEEIQQYRQKYNIAPAQPAEEGGESLFRKITAPARQSFEGLKTLYGGGEEGIANRLKRNIQEGAQDIQEGNVVKGVAKAGLRTAGDTATTIFAPIGAILGATGIGKVFDGIQKNLEQGKGLLGKGIDKITDIPEVQEFVQKHPNLAEDFDRAMNLIFSGMEKGKIDPKTAVPRTVEQIKSAPGIVADKAGEVMSTAKNRTAPIVEKVKSPFSAVEKSVDELTGTIVQGKKSDIPKARKALSNIEVDNIKTYADLEKTLNTQIQTISTKFDEVLNTRKDVKPLKDLKVTTKVGEKTVSHNYVEDALAHLDELYTKTNDPVGAEKIKQLKIKAETDGLTIKEINDLAREHGIEFKKKAFGKSGEALTSVNAQAFENTRKGIKKTARDLFGDEVFNAVDDELTNLIRTRDLVKSTGENVNKLKQRVTQRGWGEKAGRLVFQIADKFTGGGLKGFIQSFVPRGEGLKVMNALDLEKALQKNLQKLKELNSSNLPEATVIKKLEEILNQSAK